MKDSERLILLNAELQWLRLELERSDLKKELRLMYENHQRKTIAELKQIRGDLREIWAA
jgi:hypothetical protein